MIHIHKNVTNFYLKLAQKEDVFSLLIWASKTKQSWKKRNN